MNLAARILIVDDQEPVRAMLRDALVEAGYKVRTAANAAAARDALGHDTVDLALLDLVLSDETGLALAEHANAVGVPVILTSGDPGRLDDAGALPWPFLPKPFRLATLLSVVETVLDGEPTVPTRRSLWSQGGFSWWTGSDGSLVVPRGSRF